MPDRDTLIQHYLEGTLTEAEAGQLHALMEIDSSVGEELLDQIAVDAMLRASQPLASALDIRPVVVPRSRFTFRTVSGFAALAACIALVGAWIASSVLKSKGSEEETTASVAVLTRGVNLEWDSAPIAPGSPLSPGWLRLKSGIAQIEFYQGARVLVEGPAALELVSSGEATCTSGKLSAHVPPQARGFRINTPKGTIVDLGTEFGLDVSDASAEVHVFEGEVELHRAAETMRSLKEGQALAFAATSRPIEANASAFSSLRDIDERTAASQRSQFERWQDANAERNLDRALRLRFDFQDREEARSLRNHAALGADIADGSIVGGAWTEGRWPGKRALDFRNVSDRVRLAVPGETKALTLSVWVRVNGLDRTFNSLFMSEGWGDRRVHWQITHDGRVRLGVAGSKGKSHRDYDSPVVFTPECFGRWMHLAVTFDPAGKEVRHYVNGDLVAKHAVTDASPLKIGMAELGNWNDRSGKGNVAIRHLSGAMDEFALYDRVLAADEVRKLSE